MSKLFPLLALLRIDKSLDIAFKHLVDIPLFILGPMIFDQSVQMDVVMERF